MCAATRALAVRLALAPDQLKGVDQMDDATILQRVGELTVEEQRLEESHVHEPITKDELARLRAIEIELDQCWDLLRQRRARRAAGLDPAAAAVRPAEIVEEYLQ